MIHDTYISELFILLHICIGFLHGQEKAAWVDICANGFTSGECCHKSPADEDNVITTDEGMEGHQYYIDITTPRDYFDQHIHCLSYTFGDSTHGYQLATFETRKENYCVAKYINMMYPTSNFNFYIGLQADTSDYLKNAFFWDDPMTGHVGALVPADPDANVPTFTNWAYNAPNGLDCVRMSTGPSTATNGLWNDVACNTLFFSICERYVKK